MKGKIRLVLCSILLLSMLLWATPALAVPPIPHAFYGTVLINVSNAPTGTVVSAKINGVNAGSYTIKVAGQYGNVDTRDYLAVSCDGANDGDTITFYVTNENGTATGGTATFAIGGGPTRHDLSVTITPPSYGEPGAPPPAPPTIETNLFGTEESFSISDEGEIQETFTATSEDGKLTLTIEEGTIALDKDEEPLGSLEAAVDASPPDPPEGGNIIGLAYDFGPDGATFDPPITLEYTYDPDDIPEGVAEEDLVIAYYDEDAGEWVELDCVVDTENNTITASAEHFTTFAITVTVTPPEEEEVVPPEEEEVAPAPPPEEEEVAPAPPPEEEEVAPAPPPEEEEVVPEVPAPINWPLIGGIIAAVVVALLIFFLVIRRRAY